jgi:hypothetical protein
VFTARPAPFDCAVAVCKHEAVNQAVRFGNDVEAAYRLWLAANPAGYVINARGECINQSSKSHTSSRALSTKICGSDRASVDACCIQLFGRKPLPCKKCIR